VENDLMQGNEQNAIHYLYEKEAIQSGITNVGARSFARSGMKTGPFGIPLISSIAIHCLLIVLGSFFIQQSNLQHPEFLAINLVELPRTERAPPEKKIEAPAEIKKPPPLPKTEKPKPAAKAPIVKPESLPPPRPINKEDPAKTIETKPIAPSEPDPPPVAASRAPTEGGGSEAGAGNLFGMGDFGVLPGAGTADGGGGTAVSGLGRSSGAPGLPAAPLRTNREARPIQTVRATYPPMALRAGLEGDVSLKIEVDGQGKVTRAEITKSGGPGFDEEALKAVTQSRFEPAQRGGHNVPAEFTYIYRFRLQR
jgi:TonB family protein